MVDEVIEAGPPGFRPAHPGRVLRNTILPALGMPKAALARHLGLSRQTLYAIIDEQRSVTPDVAARLAAALGNSTTFWLTMQANHDAWAAERSDAVKAITRLRSA